MADLVADLQLKKNYHHGDLRTALLDQAASILMQQGESALSMRGLALEVGVSRTAAYPHFKNKLDLLCAVAEQGFTAWRKHMALQPDEWQVSEDSIFAFILRYIDYAQTQTAYYDLMFSGHIWKASSLTETLQHEAYITFKAYVALCESWQAAGLVSESIDAKRYTQVSWSSLHGMTRLLLDGIYVDQGSIEPIARAAAQMFYHRLTQADS